MATQFKNFIGGEWVSPSNGTYFEDRNSANVRDLIGDRLVRRKDAPADAMTREMGKGVAETRGDVQEASDAAYWQPKTQVGPLIHEPPAARSRRLSRSASAGCGHCSGGQAFAEPRLKDEWFYQPTSECDSFQFVRRSGRDQQRREVWLSSSIYR